jgi:CheY-like chemotaxis protein
MHWLGEAAARAGIKGATTLLIPSGTTTIEAWEIGARGLNTSPIELIDVGADDYIRKPVDPPRLIARVLRRVA